MNLIFNCMEFLSVFLLAVEAIKIKNLQWLNSTFLKFNKRLNPTISIVDEFPKNTPFVERFWFELVLSILYVLGLFFCFIAFLSLSKHIPVLSPNGALTWVACLIGLIFVPVLVGGIIYTGIVWSLSFIIKWLAWVESNTHTGLVGIIGFLLFALQYIIRRLLAP